MQVFSRFTRYGAVVSFCMLVFMLFVAAMPAAAQDDPLNRACATNPGATVCQDNQQSQSFNSNSFFGANGILTRVARLIAIATGIVSLVMIIYGGLRYTTASGDTGKLATARDTILYALAGLIIAAMAQAIVVYVLNRI